MTRQSPPGWTTTTVGEACSIRNDLRLPISREERATMEGPYPYYGPTGQLDSIADFRLDGTFALIGEDGDHFLDVEKKPQTILVSGKFNVNNHAHVIESTDLCSAEWFYNYFRHRSLKPFLTRQGAGRYKLNKAALQEIPIVLPPPEEQGAINNLFREWNTAIQRTEQLIAAKERHYSHELSRLISRGQHPHAHVGAFAEEISTRNRGSKWRTVALSDIADRIQRQSDGGDYPLLTISSASGFIKQEDRYSRYMAGESAKTYTLLRAGEFSYNKGNSKRYKPQLRALVKTGVRNNGLLNIRPDEFMRTKVPLPPIEQQLRIANYLDAASAEIDLLKQQLAALRTQKRGLMQKLLTGQWRLTVSAPQSQPGNR